MRLAPWLASRRSPYPAALLNGARLTIWAALVCPLKVAARALCAWPPKSQGTWKSTCTPDTKNKGAGMPFPN